jgi:replicative DNA helicase
LGPPFSIDRVVEAVAEAQPTILVLDYLQRIKCCDGVADTRNRLNSLMLDARTLATAGICVVLVSAVARTPSKKGGGYNAKEIGMGSFRESSEIEYGCDDAFVMVEEERRPRDDQSQRGAGTVVRQLRHVKSRNHRQQSLRLEFDGSLQRFRLLPEDAQEPEGPPVIVQAPTRAEPQANPRADSTPPSVDPWAFDFPEEE